MAVTYVNMFYGQPRPVNNIIHDNCLLCYNQSMKQYWLQHFTDVVVI